jgi:L-arabinokinase
MGYEIVRGNAHGLTDVSEFLETLGTLTFFDPHAELTITRAPGRLDVMGGIADYSGSLVLELPIAEATLVSHDHTSLARDQFGTNVIRMTTDPQRESTNLHQRLSQRSQISHKPIVSHHQLVKLSTR